MRTIWCWEEWLWLSGHPWTTLSFPGVLLGDTRTILVLSPKQRWIVILIYGLSSEQLDRVFRRHMNCIFWKKILVLYLELHWCLLLLVELIVSQPGAVCHHRRKKAASGQPLVYKYWIDKYHFASFKCVWCEASYGLWSYTASETPKKKTWLRLWTVWVQQHMNVIIPVFHQHYMA